MGEDYLIEMNVYDRMLMMKIVPARDNLERAIMSRDIKQTIAISPEELKEYDIIDKVNGRGQKVTAWNEKAMSEFKPFIFSDKETALLKELIETIKSEKQVEANDEFITFCVKITKAKTVNNINFEKAKIKDMQYDIGRGKVNKGQVEEDKSKDNKDECMLECEVCKCWAHCDQGVEDFWSIKRCGKCRPCKNKAEEGK